MDKKARVRSKRFYDENTEKVLEHRKEKIPCTECGEKISRRHMYRHKRRNHHAPRPISPVMDLLTPTCEYPYGRLPPTSPDMEPVPVTLDQHNIFINKTFVKARDPKPRRIIKNIRWAKEIEAARLIHPFEYRYWKFNNKK